MIDRACISLNARCNLNCDYCHFGSRKNKYNRALHEFTNQELDSIIDNIIKYVAANKMPTFKLGIVGSGEPLLNFDDIKRIVYRVKANEMADTFRLYTITNGTLLTNEMLDFFYDNKEIIDLNFSLDGYKEIHEIARKGFDRTFKGILKYEKKFGKKPVVNAVVSLNTIKNQTGVIDFFKHHRFTQVNFSIVFGVEAKELLIARKTYNKFLDACKEAGIMSRQVKKEKKYDCTKYGSLCGVGRTNVFITKSGIYPCARFLGDPNYRLTSFDENWDSVQRVLSSYSKPEEGACYYETVTVEGETK
ncbi:MAG: radical SAM protein [bacterium]